MEQLDSVIFLGSELALVKGPLSFPLCAKLIFHILVSDYIFWQCSGMQLAWKVPVGCKRG